MTRAERIFYSSVPVIFRHVGGWFLLETTTRVENKSDLKVMPSPHPREVGPVGAVPYTNPFETHDFVMHSTTNAVHGSMSSAPWREDSRMKMAQTHTKYIRW